MSQPVTDQEPVRLIQTADEALGIAHAVASMAMAGVIQRDASRQLPLAGLDYLSRQGLGGIGIPATHGGPGLSLAAQSETVRIISRVDPALGLILLNHFSVVRLLLDRASMEQQAKLLGPVLREGQRFGSAGPDFPEEQTAPALLQDAGPGYQLDGQKIQVLGARTAHWLAIRAADRRGNLFWVVIPRNAAGLQITDDPAGFGLRSTDRVVVNLAQIPVPAVDLLPDQGLAGQPDFRKFFIRLLQAAVDTGIARAAVEDATGFVRRFARPWVDAKTHKASEDPYTLSEFGRLYLELDAAETALVHAAKNLDLLPSGNLDAGTSARTAALVAGARALAAETALLAGEKLFELSGSRSTLAGQGFDRHWRNARAHTLASPARRMYPDVGQHYLKVPGVIGHSWI